MNQSSPRSTELFLQLGAPSDVEGIKHLLESDRPPDLTIRMEQGPS